MPSLSTPLTVSATTSIVASAWISGGISALSFCAIPAILSQSGPATTSLTSEPLVRAWYTQFTRALYIPTTAVAAALNFAYLAHRHRAAGREWRGYAGAAVANLLLPPFTKMFIISINNTLIASMSGAQGTVLSHEAARHLVERWGSLNFYRIFMPLGAAALGLWNLLC